MNRLELAVHWKSPPEGEEAHGPEAPTWARLELRVGDSVLTRHREEGAFAASDDRVEDAIEGPLSGLAEWIVDNFRHVLWEAHVPVPKLDSSNGFRSGLPGLREASNWWRGLPSGTDLKRVASWQARHTFGAASSQLAVPSMVFVAESARIGLFVALPPSDLDPNVRHQISPDRSEHWLERTDLRQQFKELVDEALRRAGADKQFERWVNWLSDRWSRSKEKEASEEERRRLRFGDVVAAAWDAKIAVDRGATPVIEGVLSDVDEIASENVLEQLLAALSLSADGSEADCGWKRHIATSQLGLAKPYEEGYELARRVRRDLRLGTDPIDRVDILLSNLNINDRNVDSGGLFRSACYVQGKQATVLVDSNAHGVTSRRVALATAFGRLLFDAKGRAWGAAYGDHARVQETRRAGAFAAELLAPSEIVTRYASEPQRLAEDYGISRSAADWRIHNVMRLAQ